MSTRGTTAATALQGQCEACAGPSAPGCICNECVEASRAGRPLYDDPAPARAVVIGVDLATKPDAVRIGVLTVSKGTVAGKIWIQHHSGEGGDFSEQNLSKLILRFFRRNF